MLLSFKHKNQQQQQLYATGWDGLRDFFLSFFKKKVILLMQSTLYVETNKKMMKMDSRECKVKELQLMCNMGKGIL